MPVGSLSSSSSIPSAFGTPFADFLSLMNSKTYDFEQEVEMDHIVEEGEQDANNSSIPKSRGKLEKAPGGRCGG
jgi:hypothetical protein